ncbi:hypothetical protein HK097_007210 [Rhizophlyctis rosea]|uniref:MYND-type domain-containing protein n=1 Tax=Rhizophlyctis rosea TaxID=64517 RepID=A0AAD5SIV3_9FUNG|nr:hypothetical protein HK097_007210 [Rhizophlyctis rosea]
MAEETPTPIFDESDDFNSTFNGTLPLPPAVSIFTVLFNDLLAFVERAQSDPLEAARQWPHVVVLLVSAVFLPSLLTALVKTYNKGAKKSSLSSWQPKTIEEEGSELAESANSAEQTEAIWEIGVSAKGVAVADEGLLRAFELIETGQKPTASQITAVIIKAIAQPTEGPFPLEKPRVLAFLQSRQCTDSVVKDVVKQVKQQLGIRVATMEELEPEMELLQKKRQEENEKKGTPEQRMMAQARAMGLPVPEEGGPAGAPGQPQQTGPKPEFAPPPLRGCFVCHNEIEGKASQCSACKAVIYCSPACAKKDWPTHKQHCPSFKTNIERIQKDKLHDLPFTYYNNQTQLASYNQVTFLIQHDVHNVGVFRRLCGCYQENPYGELAAEQIAQLQQMGQQDPVLRFRMFGLSMDLYPLSADLPADVDPRSIDTWKKFYEVRKLAFDNPAALVLEVPLTIWHIINKYCWDDIKTGPDGRRKLTIHLVGAEKEADLSGLFEILLSFLPKTDIALHMVGPALSPRLRPDHSTLGIRNETLDSSLFMTVRHGMYGPDHLSGQVYKNEGIPIGTDKPDVVIGMNAGLFTSPQWMPTLKLLVEEKQKCVFTEQMEQTVEIVKRNLASGPGLEVDFGPVVNPFRQPIWQFKKDVNLPGWSNAFMYGIFTGKH